MFTSLFGSSETIESKITNISGFDHLDITIKEGDIIKTRAECQIVLDKKLKVEANVGGNGVMSGLWRSMSTGTIFMNNISYNSEPLTVSGESVPEVKKGGATNQGKLSIYSIVPGNIKEIVIEPNGVWCIHNNSFLACSENINLTSGISLSTMVTGNGLFYTKVENTSDKSGKLWLVAYGGIVEKPLKENRDFLIHSGLFLAMKETVYNKISVNKAGTFFSAIAGGEGIMMDFSQTDTDDILYLQSGNLDAFIEFISNSMPSMNAANILPDIDDGAVNSEGTAAAAAAAAAATTTTTDAASTDAIETPPTDAASTASTDAAIETSTSTDAADAASIETPTSTDAAIETPTSTDAASIETPTPTSTDAATTDAATTDASTPAVVTPAASTDATTPAATTPAVVTPTTTTPPVTREDNSIPTITPIETGGKKSRSKYHRKGKKTRRR